MIPAAPTRATSLLPSRSVCLLILLATILGGLQIAQWAGGRPLWLDEQMVALNLRERGAVELVGPLWMNQSAPLGWLLVQRLALVLLGDGELPLRALPTLSFLATLVAAVWIGQRWMNAPGAYTLVLIVGTAEWITYYATELKPYISDVFWALWLPALAVWAAEARDVPTLRRRMTAWWIIAAVGQLMAFGAVFVMPCGAAWLVLTVWHRHGWREALRLIPMALLWLGAFAPHYLLSIRHASSSSALTDYWTFALRPIGAGPFETVAWVAERLSAFAAKPGGTTWATLFWVSAAAGWCCSRQPLGWLMASVPAVAIGLAVFRVVPLYERLALWVMPAIFVGVALTMDWVLQRGTRARFARAIAAVCVVGALLDMVPRGIQAIDRGVNTNHELDDRAGIASALAMRQPGDIVITTELGLPALWWYGPAPVAEPHRGTHLADGTPIAQARFRPGQLTCEIDALQVSPGAHVIVYLGFRFDDVPPGFDQLLFDTLGQRAHLRALHDPPGVGRIALFEVGMPAPMPQLRPRFPDEPAVADGCIEFVPARRR